MPTRILLVRHGDTSASKDGTFAGANDVPLSKEGRVHASELAVRLARYPVNAIYASSLQCAFDTAGFIARVHGLPVTPVAELREMSHGVWDGKSRADIIALSPSQLAEYDSDPFHFRPEGGESGECAPIPINPSSSSRTRRRTGWSFAISWESIRSSIARNWDSVPRA